MEQLGNITKWLPHYRPRTPDMVVNIEWPGFQVPCFALLQADSESILHAYGSNLLALPCLDCLTCSKAPALLQCCSGLSLLEGVRELCLGLQATELPVLDEDRQLDADSTNAGEQQFEKLTAGLYMGDIARRIILRCCLLLQARHARS